jgi:eukaryotic-like serine/threonine-protein kinase
LPSNTRVGSSCQLFGRALVFSSDRGGSGDVTRGPTLKEGHKIGHYIVREFLGDGALGGVYKVVDTQFDVITALKVLTADLASDPDVRARALNIFQGLAEAEHDGFVKVYEAFEAEGHLIIATDYLEGLSVRRLIDARGAKFRWEEAEPILENLCATVQRLPPGSVHGDLKPENVLILPEGVQITDFGLTRIMDGARFVAAQQRAGNRYLAPELKDSPERLLIDPAVDVYAIGAILFHLLTGKPPTGDLDSFPSQEDGCPPALDEILAKALHANPDERYESVAALHFAFAKLSGNAEAMAQAEIAMVKLPPRPPFKSAEAEPPAPAPEPPPSVAASAPDSAPEANPPEAKPSAAAPKKSLFDDDLLDDVSEKASKNAATVIGAPVAQPVQKSGFPIAAILGGLLLVAGGGGAWFFMSAEKEAPAPQIVLSTITEGEVRSYLARAEKARDDAMQVNANRHAADLFLEGMRQLREAADLNKPASYAKAISAATAAERTFADAMMRAIQADKEKAEEAERAEQQKKAQEATVQAQTPAAAPPRPKERCPAGSIHIASGSFIMGSPANDMDRNPGEKFNESVSTGAYCIDLYAFPNQKGRKPATSTNWTSARQQCQTAGKRLCSEEEWERACKGPKNLKFPYGSTFNAATCNTEDAAGEDQPLASSGQFAACKSGYGVHDMSGGVWEWTESRLQANSQDRILRGGTSTRPDYANRCANRYNSLPSVGDKEFGFRCCADPNE